MTRIEIEISEVLILIRIGLLTLVIIRKRPLKVCFSSHQSISIKIRIRQRIEAITQAGQEEQLVSFNRFSSMRLISSHSRIREDNRHFSKEETMLKLKMEFTMEIHPQG